MEKYKYKFFNNQHQLLVTIEAEHLTQALIKAGLNEYIVQYAYPGFAVITSKTGTIGVKWEDVK